MMKNLVFYTALLWLLLPANMLGQVTLGAERFEEYLPLLEGKKVGLVVNHTSLVGKPYPTTHLLDTLLSQGVNVTTIFSPEHGFRGTADAGEKVQDGIDPKSGLPVISLYGSHRKPTAKDLQDCDILIFDIQDVGARYYTYISTMHLVMEAGAEEGKPVIVLDRPNPNGFYVDGPVLEPAYSSFVGMHPVPIVHGMTVGEYAQMINGEGWLQNGVSCELTVIPCKGYNHNTYYKLYTRPSPNLPNMTSIFLYPSLCLFEGTAMSVGRGTAFPFQVVGHPDVHRSKYRFTPQPTEGAKNPKLNGELCFGTDLRAYGKDYWFNRRSLSLYWLLKFYEQFPEDQEFFTNYFDQLAGGPTLREQIQAGKTEEEIRRSWQEDLEQFKITRNKYLLYPDFN